MKQPLCVAPGKKIRLRDFDADYTGGMKNKKAGPGRTRRKRRHARRPGLPALCRKPPLAVAGAPRHGHGRQGRHDPPRDAGLQSAKLPGHVVQAARRRRAGPRFPLAHHRAAPRKGFIGIFNRSHYEDVLVVRVHNLVPKEEWESRYERINQFEKMLHEGGTTIVKVFLHISKDEQRRRLQSRLDDPKKRWKFSRADLAGAAAIGTSTSGPTRRP